MYIIVFVVQTKLNITPNTCRYGMLQLCTFLFVCVRTFPTQRKAYYIQKTKTIPYTYNLYPVSCAPMLSIRAVLAVRIHAVRIVIAGMLPQHFKDLTKYKVRKVIYVCLHMLCTYRILVHRYPHKKKIKDMYVSHVYDVDVQTWERMYTCGKVLLYIILY